MTAPPDGAGAGAQNATADVAMPTNVLIVGVGGQGVIMVSKVLAQLCQHHGLAVKQSEVHGMAKRGGGVFSHVRFGREVWSPVIPKGEADILLALEWAEGLRWLDHLKRDGGTFIADTQQIVPPIAFRDRRRGGASAYMPETPAAIVELVGNGFAVDATDMATGLGNARAANSVLLGCLSTALPFAVDSWLAVLAQSVPARTVEINRRAFLAGRDWIDSSGRRSPTATPTAAAVVQELPQRARRLEITEAWCKGCDICVKMCPERCLALDARQIVRVVDPAACTACRLCEWLCPDFAIRLVAEPAPAPAG
jgi:indolepyruvate ferredoxin oxidoreductase beta subunit